MLPSAHAEGRVVASSNDSPKAYRRKSHGEGDDASPMQENTRPASATLPGLPLLTSIPKVVSKLERRDDTQDALISHNTNHLQSTPQSFSSDERLSKLEHVSTSPTLPPSPKPAASAAFTRLPRRTITSPNLSQQSSPLIAKSPSSSHSATLGVPYASTTALGLPRSGEKPLQASSIVNGVKQHERTSTPLHVEKTQKPARKSLNLLNPMSLLVRRRSSQPSGTVFDDSQDAKNMTVPPIQFPDNYDPRIRGNVVHDFSAPRVTRNFSYNDALVHSRPSHERTLSGSNADQGLHPVPAVSEVVEFGNGDNPRRTSQQHAPFFTEHLEDDTMEEGRDSAIHAETLANAEFLSRVSRQDQQSLEGLTLPLFVSQKRLLEPLQVPTASEKWKMRFSDPAPSGPDSEVSALSARATPTTSSREFGSTVSPYATSQQAFSPPMSVDTGFDNGSGFVTNGLPADSQLEYLQNALKPTTGPESHRHRKSDASRFSFQIATQDSIAEERLLEEKHKSKNTPILAQTGRTDMEAKDEHDDEDDGEDTFDEDALYDHDELEILNDEQVHGDGKVQSRFSPRLRGHALVQGLAGLGITQQHGKSVQALGALDASPTREDFEDPHEDTIEYRVLSQGQKPRPPPLPPRDGKTNTMDSDRNMALQTLEGRQPAVSPYMQQHNYSLQHGGNPYSQTQGPEDMDDESPYSEDVEERATVEQPKELAPEPASVPQRSASSPVALAAYHSALASATHEAAASGRFTRQNSEASSASAYSHGPSGPASATQPSSAHPVDDSTGASPQFRFPPANIAGRSMDRYSGFDFGFSESSGQASAPLQSSAALFPANALSPPPFDFDDHDDLDDDFIAAANAEALESDDDGFYGQEFGFYARARGQQAADEPTNGGFFGPAGIDMIERKWSVKEPNLTPITERSEFSTRNSYIGAWGPPSASLTSPNIAAQLSRMSPLAWAQMNERSAFSPLSATGGFAYSHSPVADPGALAGNGSYSVPRGSSPMVFPYGSDGNISSAHLAGSQQDLTMHGPLGYPLAQSQQSSPVAGPSMLASPPSFSSHHAMPFDSDATPRKPATQALDMPQTPTTVKKVSSSQIPQPKGHSRSGSRESVTYVREQDAGGADRWVLERRRTSEAGLMELVGREVVEGGRI